ncbi:N-formylglutamate amidohydrolase [Trinickia violacea]|uniref:N-formylglutamate amidohydrolase n=1 Tax=Trinickia violacea TaxID=2571746 RepID=A0A4V1EH51_9BURK|nr:N-formylglutamate amidohydrolase [Trinickia violacea]QCP49050.1 N-formylglutamate amidohydrolase [Trinickia violacea]
MDNPGCELLVQGDSPILVITPHTGTYIPSELLQHAGLVPVQGRVADPAGLVLQSAARDSGASLIAARYHPCEIDFMVGVDSLPLSSGLIRGRLCRTHTSHGEDLYALRTELSAEEVEMRVEKYWRPFHRRIAEELERLRSKHSHVLLFVSHASGWLSLYRGRSTGRDCNIGTNQGKACSRQLVAALTETIQAQGRSWVVNGNSVELFTSQHYGNPVGGVHVIEAEISGRWRSDCAAQVDEALVGSNRQAAVLATLSDDQVNCGRAMTLLLTALEGGLRSLPAIPRPHESWRADASSP